MSSTRSSRWRDHPRLPEASLFVASIVWGGSYLGTRTMMGLANPLFFVGCRFGIATIIVAVFFRHAFKRIGRIEGLAMLAVGVPMAIANWLQAKGMQDIESSKSAFITAMHVPMVPILQLIFMRMVPHRMTWMGVVLCMIGLVMLAEPQTLKLSWENGEILTIFSTVAIAFEIVMIGIFAPRVDIQAITILQLGFVAIASFLAMPLLGETIPTSIPPLFWQVTILMGIASVVVQILMNWAQQTVSPTRATLIYSSEPVWAGIIGWIAGEWLGGVAMIGCGVILIGVLVSEWRPAVKVPPKRAGAAMLSRLRER